MSALQHLWAASGPGTSPRVPTRPSTRGACATEPNAVLLFAGQPQRSALAALQREHAAGLGIEKLRWRELANIPSWEDHPKPSQLKRAAKLPGEEARRRTPDFYYSPSVRPAWLLSLASSAGPSAAHIQGRSAQSFPHYLNELLSPTLQIQAKVRSLPTPVHLKQIPKPLNPRQSPLQPPAKPSFFPP